MLKPSMNELMKRVSSRYLLVNLAAQRARDISETYEKSGEKMPDKSVKLALDEIAAGTIVYRDGPKPKPEPLPEPEEPVRDMDEDEDEDEVLDLDSLEDDDEGFDDEPEPDGLFAGEPEPAVAEEF